jgi:hypothetical protein
MATKLLHEPTAMCQYAGLGCEQFRKLPVSSPSNRVGHGAANARPCPKLGSRRPKVSVSHKRAAHLRSRAKRRSERSRPGRSACERRNWQRPRRRSGQSGHQCSGQNDPLGGPTARGVASSKPAHVGSGMQPEAMAITDRERQMLGEALDESCVVGPGVAGFYRLAR